MKIKKSNIRQIAGWGVVCLLLTTLYAHSQNQIMSFNSASSNVKNNATDVNHPPRYIDTEKVSLKDALVSIEKKYKVTFFYEMEVVKGKELKMDLIRNVNGLDELLKTICDHMNVRYRKLSGSVIALYPEGEVPDNRDGASSNSQAGNSGGGIRKPNAKPAYLSTITGTVRDAETNEPIIGVSVQIKGTSTGTSTNSKGQYSIVSSSDEGVLIFSFIGYTKQEVLFNKVSPLDVKLQVSVKSVDEVVVVGYGKQKRANLTGAVASIDTKELKQSPVADLSNSLVGRMPGLIATQRSGEPGADGTSLLIRGVSTNGDNTPLFVIDGIPRKAADFNQLNPNEVESVTILKDAASSAVFGVRGANGVVLVTTKRGKTGKPVFSYSFNYGIQKPTRLPEFLDSYDYAVLYNEAKVNEGKPKLYSDADLQKFKDGSDPDRFPNTDWIAVTLKDNVPMVQQNLSVSGGSEKVKYLISGSYLNQDGLYNSVNFKRYNVRSNLDIEATATTSISLDLAARYEDRNFPGANDIWSGIVRFRPTVVSRYSNGLLGPFSFDPYTRANNSGYQKQKTNVLNSRLSVSQKIPFIKGMTVRGILAVDKQFYFAKNFVIIPETNDLLQDGTFKNTPAGDPNLYEYASQYQSVTAEGHINYDRIFGQHALNALLMYTQNVTNDNFLSAYRDGFSTPLIDNLFAGSAANRTNDGSSGRSARQGYVGRINYAYKNRYLLEANFRYDGSDNFAKDNRFGFFPSISAGWTLSEEAFIKNNLAFLDFAKLRMSYGKLGNDQIPGSRFLYLSSFKFGNPYIFGGAVVGGLNEGQLANRQATWEEAVKTDIGIEVKVLKNLLSVEFDWFQQKRSNILGSRSSAVPAIIGAALPGENFARIDSRGYEFAVSHQNSINKQLNYYVRGNFTYSTNKVIDIAEPENTEARIKQTGRPLNQFFGLQAIGLFQSADEITKAPDQGSVKPGDIRYADLNGDNKIDAGDRTLIGKSNIPEIIYGFSFGLSWKGLDVNILLQGAAQVNQYLSEEASWAFFNDGKVQKSHLDRWTPTNPGATYPRILTEDNNNRQVSSFWLKDASYLKVRNIEVGYALPQWLVSRIYASGIRFYANGMNLATFSKIKNFDPENSSSRGWAYPQQKVINFGVNVQF